jgi:cytidylate kinase
MKTIATVGVSGTGKTSLSTNLEKRLSNRVDILPEITRGEVFRYCNLSILDFSKASQKQLLEYDISSLELQIQKEKQFISYSKKEFIVLEKAAPYYLMQLLTLSARFISKNTIKQYVRDVSEHTKMHYDLLVYLPFNSFWGNSKSKQEERGFTEPHLLTVQDAALDSVLKWMSIRPFKLSGKVSNRTDVILETINIGVAAHV